jgi:hypothetical protein
MILVAFIQRFLELIEMRTPTLGQLPGLVDEFGKEFAIELFRRGNYARHFDFQVKKEFDKKKINIPIYLAIGSEFNSAALSMVLPGVNIFVSCILCDKCSPNWGLKGDKVISKGLINPILSWSIDQ